MLFSLDLSMTATTINDFVFNNPEYEEIYEFYDCDFEIVSRLKSLSNQFFVKIIASKNCQYCKIHIPRFLKIHENVEFNLDFIVWEDFTEEETFDLMDDFNLTGLPSIIIFKIKDDNTRVEIGRVVKEPEQSLEEDLLTVFEQPTLLSQNYKTVTQAYDNY